jgi:hypothetical protein
VSNHHFIEAQKLLITDNKGSGYFPPVTPENVALAQVHALLQIADHMSDISAELHMLRETLASRD